MRASSFLASFLFLLAGCSRGVEWMAYEGTIAKGSCRLASGDNIVFRFENTTGWFGEARWSHGYRVLVSIPKSKLRSREIVELGEVGAEAVTCPVSRGVPGSPTRLHGSVKLEDEPLGGFVISYRFEAEGPGIPHPGTSAFALMPLPQE